MLNYLWGFMILTGIIYAAINGTLPSVTDAALNSAKEAVALSITMVGVMSFWVGLMRIAEEAGIIKSAAQRIMPFLRFLFPHIPKDHIAFQYIATNFIANIFGLGWAATPAGLKAMEALVQLETKRQEGQGRKPAGKGIASKEMCTFLIINISSLQLIPVNISAYRSQYGSGNPAAIVGPAVAATLISTAAAIVFCRVMENRAN